MKKTLPILSVKMSQKPMWNSKNKLDRHWVRGFASDMRKGDKFPPITINNKRLIIDGNHRYEAMLMNGVKNIDVFIKQRSLINKGGE